MIYDIMHIILIECKIFDNKCSLGQCYRETICGQLIGKVFASSMALVFFSSLSPQHDVEKKKITRAMLPTHTIRILHAANNPHSFAPSHLFLHLLET